MATAKSLAITNPAADIQLLLLVLFKKNSRLLILLLLLEQGSSCIDLVPLFSFLLQRAKMLWLHLVLKLALERAPEPLSEEQSKAVKPAGTEPARAH